MAESVTGSRVIQSLIDDENSNAISRAHVALTVPQLRALHSAPVQLVAGVAGQIIVPTVMVFAFHAVSVAYAAATMTAYVDPNAPVVSPPVGWTTVPTVDDVAVATLSSDVHADPATLVGVPLMVTADVDVAVGNGTLDVTTFYHLVSV